jgi:hypothetical protein
MFYMKLGRVLMWALWTLRILVIGYLTWPAAADVAAADARRLERREGY